VKKQVIGDRDKEGSGKSGKDETSWRGRNRHRQSPVSGKYQKGNILQHASQKSKLIN